MKEPQDFPGYIEREKASEWSFYRPIMCQFITSEEVPGDSYRADQVQDVFPHGDTYMPDTGMKAKEDSFPDPVWDSRNEFEAYVRDIADFDILDYEELSFEDESLEDEIASIERNEALEGRDVYLLVSKTDEEVEALEKEVV